MSRHLFRLSAGALLGACLFSTTASAQTELIFCNKTGSKVFAAIVHLPETTKQWTLNAWYTVEPGSCRPAGKVRAGLFYYYAEKEGRKLHWPNAAQTDKTFCVPSTKIERVVAGGTCVIGERSVGFRGTTPNAGKFTINLQ